jgi:tellurite resistance protein TerC
MSVSITFWVVFNLFVLVMLALDLGVLHRRAHEASYREALSWSVLWIALSLCFSGIIFWTMGNQKGLEFLAGYVVEKSLSVDNLFLFAVIFNSFAIPMRYQHRVLFWGILGALVMRAIMIFFGITLLEKFHWLFYVFGGFLILTSIKMMVMEEKPFDPKNHPLMRWITRFFPVDTNIQGQQLFIKGANGRRVATPLFVALLFIEFTDLIFALDSIPAILAITRDPFIVYTSNVFAIMGLRSLYFLLARAMDQFHYLKMGLAVILGFVGTKMVIMDVYDIPIALSLGVIVLVLGVSIWASVRRLRRLNL